VLSVILTLVGAISYRALPITEFPEIAPPTVEVTATYPGASAEVLSTRWRRRSSRRSTASTT
jgi:HAE1 family hydrophobic/amphiphilic exporter-1